MTRSRSRPKARRSWRGPVGVPALAIVALVLVAPTGPTAEPGEPPTAVRADPPMRSSVAPDTVRLRDDLGRELRFASPPTRIVSLIPAVTELLFALEAGDRLVGRTRYGVHPPPAREVPSVGEGVRPSIESIVSRDPELVILFAGPDNRSTARELERVGVPTLALSHNGFEDLFRNLRRLGVLTGAEEEASGLARRIRCRLREIARITARAEPRRIYYEVWGDPPVTVGRGSYLDSLITLAGGENVFAGLQAPSPSVSLEAVAARDPEMIVVPASAGERDRPLPADRPGWKALEAVRSGAVHRVDGDLVHRLGPRVGHAAAALAAAIQPQLSDELASTGGPRHACAEP